MAGTNFQVPGNVWTGFTLPVPMAGGVYFVGSDNLTIYIDPLNFFFNPSTHFLSINVAGDTTGTDSINTYWQQDTFSVNSAQGLINSLTMASHTVSSCRGTGLIPVVSNTLDNIGIFSGWGYTGAAPTWVALAGMGVSAVGATASLGGQLDFYTKTDSLSPTFSKRWSIDNAGNLVPALTSYGLGTVALPLGTLYRSALLSTTGGSITLNAPSGSFRIAAGQIAVTITNSFVDANSLILLTLKTVDTTAKSAVAVPAAGSFVSTLNASATAAVDVMFFVVRTTT